MTTVLLIGIFVMLLLIYRGILQVCRNQAAIGRLLQRQGGR